MAPWNRAKSESCALLPKSKTETLSSAVPPLEFNQQVSLFVCCCFLNSYWKTPSVSDDWTNPGSGTPEPSAAAESQPGWRRHSHLHAARVASVRWVTPPCPRRGAAHSVRLENHPCGDVTPAADKDSDLCIILSASASHAAHVRKPLRTRGRYLASDSLVLTVKYEVVITAVNLATKWRRIDLKATMK